MITILLAIVAMAIKDCLGTLLVVAEARGKALAAATLDAAGDLAGVGVTLYGAGVVLQDGWTPHTGIVLAAMVATSFLGTLAWMRIAQHWMPAPIVTSQLVVPK